MSSYDSVDGYLNTIKRMEPDIHPIDGAGFYASVAISLKRIADATEQNSHILQRIADYLE